MNLNEITKLRVRDCNRYQKMLKDSENIAWYEIKKYFLYWAQRYLSIQQKYDKMKIKDDSDRAAILSTLHLHLSDIFRFVCVLQAKYARALENEYESLLKEKYLKSDVN